MIHISKLLRSFLFALRGIKTVFKEEQNFRIQIAGTLLVFIGMILLKLKTWEQTVLVLVVMLILVLELINSIFERFADLLRPRLHQGVEEVKDIMAVAVLVASVGSVFVGLQIFAPYFFEFLRSK